MKKTKQKAVAAQHCDLFFVDGSGKKRYQPPELVVFGQIHSIVAAGSGMNAEGMAMISMTRRP